MLEIGGTLWLQVVNFIILAVALTRILWKPLMETLDNRQKHIETQIKEAEGINEEARDLKVKYEGLIAQAKTEASQIVKEAVGYGEQAKEQLLSEAREEAARIRKQSEREARAEREKAMAEVKRYMADLTVSAAARVLRDSLDRETQEKLMTDFVRRVGEIHAN